MTTTVTPGLKQDRPESHDWPNLAPDPADTTPEDRANRFDPHPGTQARLRPLRRPHPGTQARLRSLRRRHPGTQARLRPLRRRHPRTQARLRPLRRRHASSLGRGSRHMLENRATFLHAHARPVLRVAAIGAAIASEQSIHTPKSIHQPRPGYLFALTYAEIIGIAAATAYALYRGARAAGLGNRISMEDGVGRRPSVRRPACRK